MTVVAGGGRAKMSAGRQRQQVSPQPGRYSLDERQTRPDGMQEFLRFLAGALIVLVVVYAGLLLFFVSGPSREDVDNLRKIVFITLLVAMVAWGLLLFMGSQMFSAGPAGEAAEAERDEEEVMLEEYLGLGEAEEMEDAGDAADETAVLDKRDSSEEEEG